MLRACRENLNVSAGVLAIIVACLPTCSVSARSSEQTDALAFSLPGGVYTNSISLQVTAVPPAVVRFTINGQEPEETSPIWNSPLTISNCTLVRAKAFYPTGTSATVCQNYLIASEDLREFSSNLPLFIINSSGTEISHLGKTLAGVRVVANGGSGRNSPGGAAEFGGCALINIRGHYSLKYPKHSYSMKTVDAAGEGAKVALLGLPKESEWVLYAPFPDKTLMRDVLAYELSNEMGQWAPRTRFVEVFVSETAGRLNKSNYVGVYVLEEKIKRDKNRVNIAKLEPSDTEEPEITGGYIFKKDHPSRKGSMKVDPDVLAVAAFASSYSSKRSGFPTPLGGFPVDPTGSGGEFETSEESTGTEPAVFFWRNERRLASRLRDAPGVLTNRFTMPVRASNTVSASFLEPAGATLEEQGFRTALVSNQFFFVEPDPEELTGVQKAWLKDYLNRLESALYGPNFTDPKRGYRAFLDSASFIDHHIIVEATKNVDGFRFSTFYHKDRNGRVKMGPLWDWNLSFGDANGKEGWLAENWLWPQLDDQQYTWFRRLFDDPDFAQEYVDRWAELRKSVLATSKVLAKIDEFASELDEAQQRNFERWPILGKAVAPNWFVGSSYDEEVQWMAEWIRARLAWMDKQFVAAPETVLNKSGSKRLVELRTELPKAKIYYTTDGSDPRAPGGKPAAHAKLYEAPITLGEKTHLFARVQHRNRWSNPVRD